MTFLQLEDGTRFQGTSFGAFQSTSGEVVFNTGLVGYPESLTDPSYKGQILVLTYPLIGNYGVPKQTAVLDRHFESHKVQISALIVSSISSEYSHWNAVQSLSDWLKEHNVPGISGIDTRQLTRKLREKGTMLGKIICNGEDIEQYNPDQHNLVAEVSCKEVHLCHPTSGVILLARQSFSVGGSEAKLACRTGRDPVSTRDSSPPMAVQNDTGNKRVVLLDCGCKNNIIHSLAGRGIEVLRVPWDYDFTSIDYDGVLISNGPGNPKNAQATINNIRKAILKKKPIFGICMGNQLLALAAGADTYKLKYGHRSQNQPCLEVGTRRCYITSQNHGYAVDEKTLPDGWRVWFKNANDGTVDGIRHESLPFMSVQFHPEAKPGPTDTAYLFDEFVDMLSSWQ
ncbi:glutamine-hydrolyzing carbamoyl-phosphate synthase small subunit [bacterium]|nr:glutamine-hydrolyzing carbamoyl-phosphate synthase small subunit [bacterium]